MSQITPLHMSAVDKTVGEETTKVALFVGETIARYAQLLVAKTCGKASHGAYGLHSNQMALQWRDP